MQYSHTQAQMIALLSLIKHAARMQGRLVAAQHAHMMINQIKFNNFDI